MEKAAVLIYNQFCNFEFSVALEIFAMAGKPITVFSKTLQPVKSEEGLTVIADETIDHLQIGEYDSLLLTGAADIREAVEDESILSFIKKFDRENIVIGAISIAPVLLLKTGMLKGKRFMAGVTKSDLLEEGFSSDEMKYMIGWDDNLKNPIPGGYIKEDNIITSVSYHFIEWAIAFAKAVGINANPKSFGIDMDGPRAHHQ